MAKNKERNVTETSKVSLTDKITKFTQDNGPKLAVALIIFAALGLSFVGYGKYKAHKELKIESELYSFRAEMETLQKNEPDSMDKEAKSEAKNPINKEARFEDIESVAKKFEAAIMNNKSSAAATTSAIELAGTYTKFKKFDLAKNLLSKISPSSEVLSSLVSNQLATVLFELGEFENAIKALDKVIKSDKHSFLHPDALLKKGLSYYKMGQNEKALASFEQVSEEFTGKSSAETADKYIRVLKFKAKSSSSN